MLFSCNTRAHNRIESGLVCLTCELVQLTHNTNDSYCYAPSDEAAVCAYLKPSTLQFSCDFTIGYNLSHIHVPGCCSLTNSLAWVLTFNILE